MTKTQDPMKSGRRWLATFFGAGFSPVAPGTAGSLAAVAVLFVAGLTPWSWVEWQGVLAAGLVAACAASVVVGRHAVADFGRKDPGPFVLDEVAGICLTALFVPLRGWHGWVTLAAVFTAFRLFDVTKPPPCHRLERLPDGWGILCDDLMAGVYANALCQLLLRVHF